MPQGMSDQLASAGQIKYIPGYDFVIGFHHVIAFQTNPLHQNFGVFLFPVLDGRMSQMKSSQLHRNKFINLSGW
jgi:hypothetical protein